MAKLTISATLIIAVLVVKCANGMLDEGFIINEAPDWELLNPDTSESLRIFAAALSTLSYVDQSSSGNHRLLGRSIQRRLVIEGGDMVMGHEYRVAFIMDQTNCALDDPNFYCRSECPGDHYPTSCSGTVKMDYESNWEPYPEKFACTA